MFLSIYIYIIALCYIIDINITSKIIIRCIIIDPLYKVGSPSLLGSWGNVHITGVETEICPLENSSSEVVPLVIGGSPLSRVSPFLNNWLHYSNYGEEKQLRFVG